MVHINLLPVREIKRRLNARRQIINFIIGLACLFVALGGVAYLQATRADQLNNELAQLRKEKKKYNKILAKIKTLEQNKALLEKRIGIIKQLKKSSSLTVHILDEIANITPTKRMWLTSLSQTGSNLQLAGMALDNRTIAKYMEDLKKSPYIKSVSLTSSSLKTYAGRDLKAFSLTCTIGMPEEAGTESTAKG
ncbi:MAG TPA: pilus assembly protein PilN [Desulfobulbus sp.]|nr:pilus assembly protein PilN [Desulfobulbus sp.]